MPEFVWETWDEWWAQSLQFVTQPDPRVSAGLPGSLSEGGRFSEVDSGHSSQGG
jgi:hypothetical protein